MTVYYVDTDGIGGTPSDSNAGTSLSEPWETIAEANATLIAGDTVYIRSGTYETSDNSIAPKNNGTGINNLITYKNYNNEEVILTGKGIYRPESPWEQNTWSLVNILNNSYICIDGIILNEPKKRWFQIQYSEYIIFKNVICKNLMTTEDGFRKAVIYNSKYLYFESLYISGSDIFQEYDALNLSDVTSLVFYDSYFGDATHQAVGTSHWNALPGDVYIALINCTIENKFHTGVGMHMTGYHFLTQGCTFKNQGIKPDQLWQDWHGSGQPDPGYYTVGQRQIVRNNTFYNNSEHLMFRPVDRTPFAYNWIYNNTLYNTHSNVMDDCIPSFSHGVPVFSEMWEEDLGRSLNDVHFFNNILWKRGENERDVLMYIKAAKGNTIVDNHFHHNIIGDPVYDTKILWKRSYYDGIDNINALSEFWDNIDSDPLFIAPDDPTPNFNLQIGSPAINNGSSITNTTNTGINSNILKVKIEDSYAFYSKKTWEHDWIPNQNIKSDLIKIGIGHPVRIDSINYDNGVITLTEVRSWNQNDPVYYCNNDQCFLGSAPDIGAFQYLGDVDPCADVVCPTVCIDNDIWSQRCDPTTGLCVADQLLLKDATTCMNKVPTDESTIQKYLIIGGLGLAGFAMLLMSRNNK